MALVVWGHVCLVSGYIKLRLWHSIVLGILCDAVVSMATGWFHHRFPAAPALVRQDMSTRVHAHIPVSNTGFIQTWRLYIAYRVFSCPFLPVSHLGSSSVIDWSGQWSLVSDEMLISEIWPLCFERLLTVFGSWQSHIRDQISETLTHIPSLQSSPLCRSAIASQVDFTAYCWATHNTCLSNARCQLFRNKMLYINFSTVTLLTYPIWAALF